MTRARNRRAHVWTPEIDAEIRRLRGENLTWGAIGTAMNIPARTAQDRGERLGLNMKLPKPERHAPIVHTRDPLPAGHSRTWQLLNAGLVSLADCDYPPLHVVMAHRWGGPVAVR